MIWKKLLEPDGTYAVDEAERYLFAIELSDGSWDYFIDSLIWDSETPPSWYAAEHGWDGCEDQMWFMPLPAPPEADQPAPTETVPQVAPIVKLHPGPRVGQPQGAPDICTCGHRQWAHNAKGFCNTCSCGQFKAATEVVK